MQVKIQMRPPFLEDVIDDGAVMFATFAHHDFNNKAVCWCKINTANQSHILVKMMQEQTKSK